MESQRLDWSTSICCNLLLVTRLIVRSISPTSETIARLVESRYPELRQTLITAVDPQVRLWGNPLLGKEVRDKSLQHAYRNPWTRIISWKQRIALSFVNLLLFAGFAGFAILMMSHPASGRNSLSRKAPQGQLIQGMKVDPATSKSNEDHRLPSRQRSVRKVR